MINGNFWFSCENNINDEIFCIAIPRKFKELFDLYDCNLNDENIKQDVDKILAAHYDENNTTEVYKQCLSQIDLTSLNGTDTDGEIIAMVNKVNHFKANYPALPNVGAICVYPALVPVVKEHLSAGVGIAAVSAGFPASQTFIEVKVAETAMCVMEGATEVAATLEATYIMCQAIKEWYEKTGVKVSYKPAGGIVTTEDAVKHYTLVKEILGAEWLNNTMFRFGASRLANNLLSSIEGKEVKYF